MRKTTLIFALLLVCAFACKKKANQGQAKEDKEITLPDASNDSGETASFEKVNDCDEFLDQYEEWTGDYVSFMEKYKDNPVDAISDPEYSKMLMKATSWSSQWPTLATSCASNDGYEKRFRKISDGMQEKMKEMGFK